MASRSNVVSLAVGDEDNARAQAVTLLKQLASAMKANERVSMAVAEQDRLDSLIVKLSLTIPSPKRHEFIHEAWCPGGQFCACPGAPTPAGRKAPTRTGKLGVQITTPDGETTRFESASAAAKWLAATYPEKAASSRAYTATIAAGKAANARTYIMRDMGRLEGLSIEFDA